MRAARWLVCISLVIMGPEALLGQPPSWTVMAGVRGSYTSSTRLFTNPDAASAAVRASHSTFEGVYAGGFEVRWKPLDAEYFVSVMAEYLVERGDGTRVVRSQLGNLSVPASEGFEALPIELSGNIYIPLGSPTLRLFMGGGVGTTLVRRLLSVGGIDAPSVTTPFSVGIHVRTALEYRVRRGIALVGEVRLRDPEAITTNRFEAAAGTYRGIRFELPTSEFRGKVHVDGMNLSLGIMFDVL